MSEVTIKRNKIKKQSRLPRNKKHLIEPIIFHTLNYAFLLLLGAIMLYPMLNTAAIAFNEGLDAVRGGITIWPRSFTLENFQTVLSFHTIYDAFFMSVARTVVQVGTGLFVTSMLAYAVSRKEYKLAKPITLIFVITMYFNAGLIPYFILIQSLGMVNTFAVYWIPTLISPFFLILIRAYIRGIPESIIEAARIDGANDWCIYLRIIMPLCKPVLATIALFIAVGAWNAWFDAFIFNSGAQHLSVLQFELQKLLASAMMLGQGQASLALQQAQAAAGHTLITPLTIRSAITIIATVPILLVYPFLQRYFVHGVQLGGIKE